MLAGCATLKQPQRKLGQPLLIELQHRFGWTRVGSRYNIIQESTPTNSATSTRFVAVFSKGAEGKPQLAIEFACLSAATASRREAQPYSAALSTTPNEVSDTQTGTNSASG